MSCDVIRPRIRPFLDDLLDEKDYRDTHAHLESCAACHRYAASVGTLSFRLYELGQVPLPPDMVSAILYESKKEEALPPPGAREPVPAVPGVFVPKKDLVWAGIAVVLALTVVAFAVTAAFHKREEKAAPARVPVPAAAPQTAPETEEAGSAEAPQVSVSVE